MQMNTYHTAIGPLCPWRKPCESLCHRTYCSCSFSSASLYTSVSFPLSLFLIPFFSTLSFYHYLHHFLQEVVLQGLPWLLPSSVLPSIASRKIACHAALPTQKYCSTRSSSLRSAIGFFLWVRSNSRVSNYTLPYHLVCTLYWPCWAVPQQTFSLLT